MGIRDRPITPDAMAKRHCRTSDRDAAPRMPGPARCFWRGAFAPRALCLGGLLQSDTPAHGITKKCTIRTGCLSGLAPLSTCRSWRVCIIITSGMIFGKDNRSRQKIFQLVLYRLINPTPTPIHPAVLFGRRPVIHINPLKRVAVAIKGEGAERVELRKAS
jgi:hypothetical protein